MFIPTRLLSIGAAAAASLVVGLGVAPSGVHAQTPATCTATLTPSTVVINANEDLTAGSSTLSLTSDGDWPLLNDVPVTYLFIGIESPTRTIPPTVLTAFPAEQSSGEPTSYAAIVDFMMMVLGEEPTTGEYTLSLDFSTTADSLTSKCSAEWSITFVAEGDSLPVDDLPETGAHTGVISLWVTALLGIGAVSAFAASRRRA